MTTPNAILLIAASIAFFLFWTKRRTSSATISPLARIVDTKPLTSSISQPEPDAETLFKRAILKAKQEAMENVAKIHAQEAFQAARDRWTAPFSEKGKAG